MRLFIASASEIQSFWQKVLFPVDKIQEGFDLIVAGKSGKIALD